jgi:hypothetical protein
VAIAIWLFGMAIAPAEKVIPNWAPVKSPLVEWEE